MRLTSINTPDNVDKDSNPYSNISNNTCLELPLTEGQAEAVHRSIVYARPVRYYFITWSVYEHYKCYFKQHSVAQGVSRLTPTQLMCWADIVIEGSQLIKRRDGRNIDVFVSDSEIKDMVRGFNGLVLYR